MRRHPFKLSLETAILDFDFYGGYVSYCGAEKTRVI